jgi:5-formyltetrahydrofolate cyclo-ligase
VTSRYTKVELRRLMRARRAAQSPDEQVRAAVRLATHVSRTRYYHASRKIACYLPINGEIDPRVLMEHIWKSGKMCYLPLVPHHAHKPLWFAPVDPDTRLVENRFGIPEPLVGVRELVCARRLDLILLPLVGFDQKGNRLGMGSGFYDRTLAFLRHREHWKKPHTVGLAHDFQRVDDFDVDPWDIPLTAVVTDQDIYSF